MYFSQKQGFSNPYGNFGLAFETVDYYDKASNSLGIYKSYLLNNKDTIFGQKIDSVSFENTKQINTHCDYEEFNSNKRKFQKSFKTNSNPLTIYEFENLLDSPSKGSYLHRNYKNVYPYERIG